MKRLPRISAVLLLLVIAVHICFPAAQVAYGANSSKRHTSTTNCKYDISVHIDEGKKTLTTTARMLYRNASPDTLDELVLHFTPSKAAKLRGEFTITDTHNRSLRVLPYVQGEKESPEGYFRVRLSEPLAAGKVVELEMGSSAVIKDRYGIKYLEGCWHPKVVKRFGKGWQIGVEEFADYRVTIGPLGQSLIPTSGKLLERREGTGGRWTIVTEAKNIPDYGIVFSHSDYVVSGVEGDVTVNCFYVRDKDVAERILTVAKDVIRFYRGMYGFYPDRVLNIIAFDGSGFGGGPIGSNIVHVNKTFDWSEDGTIWAVAHEIAHEYWGWNWVRRSRRSSWLCLGMGLWSDRQYMLTKGGGGQNSSTLGEYVQAARRGLNTKLHDPTPADLKHRMNENKLAHSKGYAIALMLEYLVGKEAFGKIAKGCLHRFAHQPIDVAGFQGVCEEITDKKLDWFFQQWVNTNDTLDYAVKSVETRKRDRTQQIIVTIVPKGPARMPIDVQLEFTDGSSSVNKPVPRNKTTCVFTTDKHWYRVILDPEMSLPDTDLSNNWKLNSQATPPFEVLNVDLGDKAWGRNLLRVHVKNTTDQKRSLKVHIGTGRRRGDGRCGFGMGKRYTIEPQEDRWIDHWYWVPPAHGVVDAVVTLRDLTGRRTKVQPPAFLTRSYELHFSIPNSKCNNLTITEKLPVFKKFFKGLRRLEPFGHFATEHFVFYCSPNTPAYAEIKKIMTQRESALKRACDFIGVKPSQQIVVFFYPDRITKRMCTHHEGDGLAHGNTIHEVYNDKVKLDPYHETVHIVMRPMGNPPAVFNEGFAVYMQEGHRWHGLHVDVIAAKLAQGGRRADLKKLLTREEIGSQNDDGKVAYPQSGSFVGFLIESFGKDKFLQAYKELKNPRNKSMQSRNKRTLERIYGRSLHELEREWQSMLEAADVP